MNPALLELLGARVAAAESGGLTFTYTQTGAGQASMPVTVNIGTASAGRMVIAYFVWSRTSTTGRGSSQPKINGYEPLWSAKSHESSISGYAAFGQVVESGETATVGVSFGSSSTPTWRLMVYTAPFAVDLVEGTIVRNVGSLGGPLSATVAAVAGDFILGGRSSLTGGAFTGGVTDDSEDALASVGRGVVSSGTSHTVTFDPEGAPDNERASVSAISLRRA